MGFKKVSGTRKYFKYKDCAPGQVLVENGEYLGSEEGKFGIQHLFRQEDGETVCLNSAGHLNYLIEKNVKPGMHCNVIYAEKVALTSGTFAGKEAHNFELEIDEGDLKRPPVKASVEVAATADEDITL
jgi:acetyltransferase-like isoleucine patch superfamily enzyme